MLCATVDSMNMLDAINFLFGLVSWETVLNIAVGGTLAIPLGYAARRVWHKCTTEFDRSMLIRLIADRCGICKGCKKQKKCEKTHHPTDFSLVPVIVGKYPFSELRGKVESNLDSRDVIGFVVGDVKWIDDPTRLKLNPCKNKPGFYAYCVIQWEHADQVRRLYKQGFGVRKIQHKSKSNPRENSFIGFGTDVPDGQEIVHWQKGIFASWRYQPYYKAGFHACDIRMRQLAPQTRLLIWLKNFVTKEWDNAWQ